jgi:hypothetical protein
MNSFNQTNPIANYHEIIQHLQDLGNNIQKIRLRLGIILQQILENPEVKKLIMNNIGLIKQYFAIQIQLNNLLRDKFKFIPYSNKYYDYIINLNQNLLIKITTFAAILETGDNVKIQQYINSLSNIEMAGIYLTFGDRLKDITAFSLEKIAHNIRHFNSEQFMKETKSKLENIQNTLQTKLQILSDTIQNNSNTNVSNDNISDKIPETNTMNQEGGKKLNTIFHPELKKWVNIRSTYGMDALLKYAYYN